MSCSYFYIPLHFFDLKNLSHWGLNQSRRFTCLLCSLLGAYHIFYCRHFLTILFNFHLENTDAITAHKTVFLIPPLTSGLGNGEAVPSCAACAHANHLGTVHLSHTSEHHFLCRISLLKMFQVANTTL